MPSEAPTINRHETIQQSLSSSFTKTEIAQLEEYREKLYVAPPGIDNRDVTNSVPSVEEIVSDISKNTHLYRESREAALAAHIPPEDYDELIAQPEISLFTIFSGNSAINLENAPNRHEGIKKHWKKLIKTLPVGTTIRQYGDLVMAEYPLGMAIEDERGGFIPPNQVKVIFDLGTGVSSRERGIKIRAMIQERGEDGACFDAAGQLSGFSNIYFKKEGWLIELLQGTGNAIATASPGFGSIPSSVDVRTFTVGKRGLGGDTLTHELIHIDDYRKKKLSSPAALNIVTLNENILLPLSAVASIVTLNPWLVMPSLLATVAAYLSSRTDGHTLNRNIKDRFSLEKRAYLYQLIFTILMEKNGFQFRSRSPYNTVPEFSNQYIEETNANLIYYYQPMVWGLIDSIRLKIRDEDKATIPNGKLVFAV